MIQIEVHILTQTNRYKIKLNTERKQKVTEKLIRILAERDRYNKIILNKVIPYYH